MLIDYKLTQTAVIVRVKILDSSVSTGAGKTGLTNASSGLVVSTIADNEATATAYTAAGSTIDTIATLGTYAAPTAGHCRFKEVDATNHKGLYELQFENARFAVANAKSLVVSISGATNAADCDAVIPLRAVDPYDGVRFGMTAIPNVAQGSNGAIPTGDASGRTTPVPADGVSYVSIMEMLVAFMECNKSTVVDNGDGTVTTTFYKQDGVTTKFSVTYNKSTGVRTAASILH